MKKFYLLITILCTAFLNAQIFNIPDANFKAHLLLASKSNYIAFNATGANIRIDTNNYFIQVQTDFGISSTKFIKK